MWQQLSIRETRYRSAFTAHICRRLDICDLPVAPVVLGRGNYEDVVTVRQVLTDELVLLISIPVDVETGQAKVRNFQDRLIFSIAINVFTTVNSLRARVRLIRPRTLKPVARFS
jgi:hypothetical protein